MGRKTKINIAALLRAKLRAILTTSGLRMTMTAAFLCIAFSLPAGATYIPFNTNVNMNVGIGTTTPQAAFVVPNGNVGIGTWTAAGGNLIVRGTGNVGIGSAWPGQTLDVQGTIRTTGFTLNLNPSAGYVIVGNGVGVGTWMAGNTLPGTISGLTTNYVTKASSASSITNSLIFDNGTNVGIGSSNPNAALDVNGIISVEGVGNSYFSSNVGIGSATPGTPLDVQGTVRMTALTLTGNGAANGNVLVGNSVGVGTWMPASTLGVSGSSANYWLNDTGNIGISTAYAVGIGTISQINTLNILGNIGVGTVSYSTYLKTPAPLGGAIFEGNVGIGTFWASGNNLTVGIDEGPFGPVGTVGIGTISTANSVVVNTQRYSLEIDGVYGLMGLFSDSTGRQAVVEYGSGTGSGSVVGYTGFNGTDLAVMESKSSANLVFGTNNIENMRIMFGGNVGIGTTAPVAALGIVGNVGIGTGINSLYVTTTPPSGGMIIQNNVGIGSLHPGQMLDVQGTARMTGLTLTGNGAANGNVLVGNSVGVGTWMPVSTLGAAAGTNYWLLNGGAGNVGINTSYAVGIGTSFVGGSGEASFAVMNGNVGIGTWLPQAPMEIISGNGVSSLMLTNTSGTTGQIQLGNGINAQYSSLAFNSGGDNSLTFTNYFTGGTQNAMIFSPAQSEAMRIVQGGMVGIGTSTPVGALAVMSGNVGFGTWAPIVPLQIVGIGTQTPNGGGLIINNGNVGINTTVPGSALYVGNGVITSYNTSANSGEGIVTYAGNGKAINMQAGTANANILYDNTGGFSFQSEARGSVLAGTSSSANITMNIDVNGNVGIGTFAFNTAGLAVMNGNVGVGSLHPGKELDVIGTSRMLGLVLTGNGAANGNVLVGNSVGVGTWMPANTLGVSGGSGTNFWLNDTGNIGISTAYAVGIGTISQINKLNILGNIGIGTFSYDPFMKTPAPSGGMIVSGNIGIGSWVPQSPLDLYSGGNDLSFFVNIFGENMINSLSELQITLNNSSGRSIFLAQGGNSGLIGTVGINQQNPGAVLDVDALTDTANIFDLTSGSGVEGDLLTVTSSGNIGVGTINPVSKLAVVGNIGIGAGINSPYVTTSPPNGGMIVQGNIGVGSLRPGQILDVQGTVRTTGLTLTGNGAANGNVLVGNSVGIGTWMPASTLGAASGTNYWLLNGGGNVGINTTQAVGIGTSFVGGTGEATLSVMNGNVGIGTWVPSDLLQVGKYKSTASGFEVDSNGNVGIGTIITNNAPLVIMNGNVGIGTWAPTYTLESKTGDWHIGNFANLWIDSGSTINFGPEGSVVPQITGSFLTPTNFLGLSIDGTANSLVIDGSGNIGIGTDTPIGGFLITNGNVGIGTWTAMGGQLIVRGPGNVGIGSAWPGKTLDINGTARMTGFTLTGNGAANGNVLVGNSVGIGTWMPASTLGVTGASGTNFWLNDTGNIGISTAYAVGIGTISQVNKLNILGNIGIGTFSYDPYMKTAAPNGGMIIAGNVGIGSFLPAGTLDVEGGTAAVNTNGSNINIVAQNAGGPP